MTVLGWLDPNQFNVKNSTHNSFATLYFDKTFCPMLETVRNKAHAWRNQNREKVLYFSGSYVAVLQIGCFKKRESNRAYVVLLPQKRAYNTPNTAYQFWDWMGNIYHQSTTLFSHPLIFSFNFPHHYTLTHKNHNLACGKYFNNNLLQQCTLYEWRHQVWNEV